MDPTDRRAKGDEGLLFLEFNEQLLRRVHSLVHASPQTIEDACAFAWMQLLRHQPDRDGEWKAWLVRTAQREAWRLHRAARDVPLVPLGPTRKHDWTGEPVDPSDRLATSADLEEAVQVLGQLPPRLRRIAFLRARRLLAEPMMPTAAPNTRASPRARTRGSRTTQARDDT
jgi:DNA-directed RNA polymerase specialized sigma24 family protein